MKIENKLKELGLSLPEVPKPVAEFIPAKIVGNLVFCSGQGIKVMVDFLGWDKIYGKTVTVLLSRLAVNIMFSELSLVGDADWS